jgi:hypothetical protein
VKNASPVAKKIARDRLHNCKQNHTESIAEFKRRFDDALAMYNHTGCEEIDEATIAVDFLYQLDSQRFTSLRVELENDINSGLRTMPATLADAYHLASTYKVTASSGKAVLATAFVTRKEQTKKETKNVDSPIKEKKTERSKSSSPPKPCKHCGGDHWNAKCPNKPKADQSIVSPSHSQDNSTMNSIDSGKVNLTFTRSTVDCRGVVLRMNEIESNPNPQTLFTVSLDTCANVSVFNNPQLLSNLQPSSTELSAGGIDSNGKPLICKHVGFFEPLGVLAYYSPHSSANILCFFDVKEVCDVDWNQDTNNMSVVNRSTGLELIFTATDNVRDPDRKLYVCDLRSYYDTPITGVSRVTVGEQEMLYKRDEIEKAKQAREVSRRLGFPSKGALVELMNHGGINESPVTAEDVRRADHIYGPDIPLLKGKTVKKPSLPYKQEPIPRLISSIVSLSIDIMFVLSHAFLLSVGDPLAFTMATHLGWELGRRAKATLRKALHQQLALYKAHGFLVKYIHTDGEGAIASLSTELAGTHGIIMNPSGPGQHVASIERKAREIKERTRCIIHSLPY